MPKIKYAEKKLSPEKIATIVRANTIIAEFKAIGHSLSLRQLYYQFVARDYIENSQKEYKKLGVVISDGRLAGLIDWEAIEDRGRELRQNQHWNSPREIVEACARGYQIDKWEGQERKVEVWIEKDALVGVIENVCRRWDTPYFSCRGYTSQSEMWSAAQRHLAYEERGMHPVILHLGDHDPSGKDMTRDIGDRMRLFGATITVHRIALNKNQIDQYDPPPNFAKMTDPRAEEYVAEFGEDSWELDALDPRVIEALIEENIHEHLDMSLWDKQVKIQERERKTLNKVAKDHL